MFKKLRLFTACICTDRGYVLCQAVSTPNVCVMRIIFTENNGDAWYPKLVEMAD